MLPSTARRMFYNLKVGLGYTDAFITTYPQILITLKHHHINISLLITVFSTMEVIIDSVEDAPYFEGGFRDLKEWRREISTEAPG